jgi:hypothetical protein
LSARSYATAQHCLVDARSDAHHTLNFVTIFLQAVASVKFTTQFVGCGFQFACRII